MANLLDKLKKSGTIKTAEILSNSIYFIDKETVRTDLPVLNIAFSGDLDLGYQAGITVIAGPTKSYKSLLSLYCMKAYLDKYDDSIALFYDSEFGTNQNYLRSLGFTEVEISRILHLPITNLEELKFDITAKLEQTERGNHIFILIDSLGNLASKREYENAVNENTSKDMSRAADIKSLFRIITPHITMKNIPCFVVNHVYKSVGSFIPQDVVAGGCVVKDTLVETIMGTMPIQDVTIGMLVKSADGQIGEVTNTWNKTNLAVPFPECYEIVLNGGYKIVCSDHHKFIKHKKWTEAKNLKEGDYIATQTGTIKIVKITNIGKREVYDIEVDRHSYIIDVYPTEKVVVDEKPEDNLNSLEQLNDVKFKEKEIEVSGKMIGVISHNSGILYSSNTIITINSKSKITGASSSDIIGYQFNVTIEKSRNVKEKAKLNFSVYYDTGIAPYSCLLDIALSDPDNKFVIKPSSGWYSRVNPDTGEVEDKKYREKDTNTKEFWEPIIHNEKFLDFIRDKYQIGRGKPIESDEDEIKIEEIE